MSRTEVLNAPEPFPYKRFFKWTAAALVLMFLVRGWIIDQVYRIALSKSESLETAIFFIKPIDSLPERGDYLYFTAPNNPYFSGPAVKRVVGLPGDAIEIVDRDVIVGGSRIGRAKPLTRMGDPLTPVELTVVPENYVFVAGDHIDSFDSRYAEFGLVPGYLILGTGRAIF